MLPIKYRKHLQYRLHRRHQLEPQSFLHFEFKGVPAVSFVISAISTPNTSILTAQEAFKGFNLGDDSNDQLSHVPVAVSKDELDISELGFPSQLVDSLQRRGITNLFPIQRVALLPAIEGRDIIARARTGTGKTLAFGIPIIKGLAENRQSTMRRSGWLPKVLVLAPTRELAKQQHRCSCLQNREIGENKKSGEVYRLFDVGGAIRHGQPNKLASMHPHNKFHLFTGVVFGNLRFKFHSVLIRVSLRFGYVHRFMFKYVVITSSLVKFGYAGTFGY
ncbi:hypothetical protein KIW84_034582 [Lathyrus oleraceus]|uniref:Helicase ATP-binding domain-containing protein n=1 Tax=Pisum sativum TaxID=3888 RepID=A0A9D5B5E2_PEA|nr:hypothetical protein KIW84_034582 [Pisum sativum]